jgi:PAS domain S-box-containing protein
MTTLHFLKDPELESGTPDTDTPHVAFFRKASRVLGWITLLLGVLSTLWCALAHSPENVRDGLFGIPLPHLCLPTVFCFVLIGLGVLSVHTAPHLRRWLQSGLGLFTIILGSISASHSMPASWHIGGLTAWVMLLLGFSLAAGGSRLPIIGYVRQSALFVVFFLCGLVVVGHAYDVSGDMPYMAGYFQLPWTAAFTGIVAGHALLFQYPNFGVMRLISGEGFGCHIMRRLLPSVILLLLTLGAVLAYGENRGLYPPAFGEGLYAILAVTGFSGILLFTAASLNRLDGERRAREEDLRRSQSQLQSVLDQIPSIICIKSPAERYLMVNKQFVVSTGLKAEDCVGRSAAEIFPKDTAAVIQQGFRGALSTHAAVSSIDVIEQDDGTHTYLSAHFPLLNTYGEAYAVCGVYTDVSDIKRQEAEIRSLNESLREKTQRQEAANAELEAFSYSVSHDLRAPLRHIAGFGKLLAQRNLGKLDEKSLHYLNVIETSVGRMGALIDDLLSFSRASKVDLVVRRIQTAELVTEVRQELATQKPGHTISWDIGDLPDVYGDPAMVRLVWINLLSNAVKYSGKNPAPHIKVSYAAGSDGGVFSIRDNGAGFDMRYADKLFGVFQRLHSNQEYEGTGIGLAMVRRILERHGGRIWAEAVPGEGACFYFFLPDKPLLKSAALPIFEAQSTQSQESTST